MERLEPNQQETIMREAFSKRSSEIVQNETHFIKPPGIIRVGLEMEASLITENVSQVPEAIRNNIVLTNGDIADVELGASQIEWRTKPVVLNEDSGLPKLIAHAVMGDQLIKITAENFGVRLLRSGSNPFIPLSLIVRTDKSKYQMVPDFHNSHRSRPDTLIGNTERIDVGEAAVVSLLNSLQCNIEAENFADAIDLTNRSLMIGPMVVALSGNARMLAGVDTGLSDIRNIAWEISHDVRSVDERNQGKALRIGLPSEYFTDLPDYFERIQQHPFILFDPDHALEIGIGLFWQDTRIKLIGNSVVVEFRPTSIQPTVEEDIAVMLFYLGRLQWSKSSQEELLPIQVVRKNRIAAMINGIHSQQNLLEEVQKAEDQLISMGLGKYVYSFMDILKKRISARMTPSDVVAKRLQQFEQEGNGRFDAMKKVLLI